MKLTETKSEDNLLLQLSVARITFLKFNEKKKLIENLDSYNELALLSIEDISSIIGRKIKSVNWNGSENLKRAGISLYLTKKLGIKILGWWEIEYPELLRQIYDPPYLLFCRGNYSILGSPCVSVVGTRRTTPQGKEAAWKFGYDAGLSGINVVSGLASGIDGFAHKGCLDAYYQVLKAGIAQVTPGKTIAVLPSGIDTIVPGVHKKLAAGILQTGGCIISEYEPGMEMADWHFVKRNRIIAGLSPSVVVIEAPAGSGALITADFALEMNRDVIFHKAAFNSLAVQVDSLAQQQLAEKLGRKEVSKYKAENCSRRFLEAGAPVVEDFEDYCRCLKEAPGGRSIKQGLLFEV